jgi:hypothetical protein
MTDPRFPIGKFSWPEAVTPEDRAGYIEKIAATPEKMHLAVAGLNDEQLDTPYREGGWTVRQLVHHVPDSHLNSYVRFKLALTENEPTVKTYDESAWAQLADSTVTPIETSLCMLDCLHSRWVKLMRGMTEAEWARSFRHPELGLVSLAKNASLYAWHGDHHIAHITSLRAHKGW